MKYEWRKKDKSIYIPKEVPEILDVESYKYLAISGEGNPNSELFQLCTEALYALSYGIKMAPKKGIKIEGYFDYTVFPLEGVWDLNDKGRELYGNDNDVTKLKDYLMFTLMIRQPDFVTQELFESIKSTVFTKKKNDAILEVSLIESKNETVCQCLHIGNYDSEPSTFKKMEQYCEDNGYKRLYKTHREIYISDPRKVDEDKLKTTLRFEVARK